ncbi:MAG: hypothetical protein LBT40_13790, partial [Deltaproteobacteria bacterium]|nr:hypothetical protein [Deltaproteobacteria bacterium]
MTRPVCRASGPKLAMEAGFRTGTRPGCRPSGAKPPRVAGFRTVASRLRHGRGLAAGFGYSA